MSKNSDAVDRDVLIMYEFPPFVLELPNIIAGFIFVAFQEMGLTSAWTTAFIWGIFLLITKVMVGMDFGLWESVAAVLLLITMWALGWLTWVTQVQALDLVVSSHFVLWINSVLAFFYVLMLLNVWLNYRWVASGETMRRRILFRGEECLPLIAARPPQKEIRDTLEYAIYRAGRLVCPDGRGGVRVIYVLRVTKKYNTLRRFTENVDIEIDDPSSPQHVE